MKKMFLSLGNLLLISTMLVAQNEQAPKIIRTVPAFGDFNVDANLKEVIIEFDQDMGPGYSFVTTPNNPQGTGIPTWVNERTLSYPVSLSSNSFYVIQLNNAKFSSFRNKAGIALNPDQLLFHTKMVDSKASNKKAFSELFKYFPTYYSYSEFKGIDWKKEFNSQEDKLKNVPTNLEFAVNLVSILKKANDVHIWIEVDGLKLTTGSMKIVKANYGSSKILTSLKDIKYSEAVKAICGTMEDVGYISVKEWTFDLVNSTFKSMSISNKGNISFNEVIDELLLKPNLIIDVRENAGGNESFAQAFASLFIRDSVAFEKVKNLNEETGKFDIERVKWIHESDNPKKYSGKIYVLSGPSVMSSNESFILMMKQIPNTKVVGMRSYGSSGNPRPVELSNGVKIFIPSWQAFTLDNKLIEGNGIDPDIEIRTNTADFTMQKDPLWEKLMEIIKTSN